MTPLSAFAPYVTPHTPGASDPFVEQAVRTAATEFCAKTNIVQRIETQNITANQSTFIVTEPTEMQLVDVLLVSFGATRLSPVAAGSVQLPAAIRGAVDGTTPSTGTPNVYYQLNPTSATFSLYPLPDRAITGGLLIRSAFAPTVNAANVDDRLFTFYAASVADGALAILLSTPNQPFSNPGMAAVKRQMFESAIASAERDARIGMVQTGQRVALRRFA